MRVKYICEAHGYIVYNSSSGDFVATASINTPPDRDWETF